MQGEISWNATLPFSYEKKCWFVTATLENVLNWALKENRGTDNNMMPWIKMSVFRPTLQYHMAPNVCETCKIQEDSGMCCTGMYVLFSVYRFHK